MYNTRYHIISVTNCDAISPVIKLEAKDVLSNINHMQGAERAKKYRFLSLVTLSFKFVREGDKTSLPCEFGANPFSSSVDNSYTNKQRAQQ